MFLLDTIFDAMSRMEGAEIYPNTEVYNSIIYAFSRSCDAVAAEFYFLEMKSKNLKTTKESYNSLLNAYARNQAVGIKPYGYLGRYVRPEKAAKSALESDMLRIGAERSAEIISENIDYEGDGGRKDKYKGKLIDYDESFDTPRNRAAAEISMVLYCVS